MRKVDVYVSLKTYRVDDGVANGARAMANWYAMEGNETKRQGIEMLILEWENGNRIVTGVSCGKLKAYATRFAKLCESVA